jgi:hypothetical protein
MYILVEFDFSIDLISSPCRIMVMFSLTEVAASIRVAFSMMTLDAEKA